MAHSDGLLEVTGDVIQKYGTTLHIEGEERAR